MNSDREFLWSSLLGLRKESDEFQQLLDGLKALCSTAPEHEAGSSLAPTLPYETISYKDGSTYLCFYQLGISLCLIKNQLESVDFYKSGLKYKAVSQPLLPRGITLDMTGKQFVDKFGEPVNKGGGGSSRGSAKIWLRWANIQVDIDSRDWNEGSGSSWDSLTIFV